MTSPSDLAQLEKDKRAFMASMQKVTGVEQATQRVNSDQFQIPLFVLGHSKLKTERFPMLIYTVMPDFRKFANILHAMPELNEKTGAIEMIVDARGKDQREREGKQKPPLDMEKQPIYNQEDVIGRPDPHGQFRRVRIRLAPGDMVTFRNKDAQSTALTPCTFAILNVQAGAWHEDSGFVACVPKVVSVVDTITAPSEIAFIDWMYNSGMWTKTFFTKVAHYKKSMAVMVAEQKKRKAEKVAAPVVEGAPPAAEVGGELDTASIRYRNDNQMIIAFGFEDRLMEQLHNPVGCHFTDKTDITKESNLVDTRNGTPRYLGVLQGKQWTTNSQGVKTETHFTTSTPLYPDVIERLGISSITNWKTLLPTLRSNMKALVVTCEDAQKTFESALVQQRLNESDDVDYINKPLPNTISFAVGITLRGVIFDPVATITGISIPVSPKTIRDFFWNGESKPPSIPQDARPSQGADKRLINLSESRDECPQFDNKDFTLHLLTNVTIIDMQGNTQPLTVLGNLNLEEGDCLARYLATCVLAGGANVPKQEYLDTLEDTNPEERAKITSASAINRYIFNMSGTAPIKYVFAVNRASMAEDARIFSQKAQRLKLLPILAPGTNNSKTASVVVPGSGAGEVPSTPVATSLQVEEVHSPNRAKSPERSKSPPRKRKRADEESASSDHDTRASKKKRAAAATEASKTKSKSKVKAKVPEPVLEDEMEVDGEDKEEKEDEEENEHHENGEEEEEEDNGAIAFV